MTIVGIDLGTTISSVARVESSGAVRLARLRDGSPRLRSVIAVEPDGRLVVGDQAQALTPLDPDSAFAFFKRQMGTSWTVSHGGRSWTATELSAEVLKALVQDAGEDFGQRPTQAVLTIPAYFGDDARRATLEAGRLAGIEVLALQHEPTAACLAYGSRDRHETLLVYDLGGGTFDVSVVRFAPEGIEVLATAGDDQLGGKDWDDVLVDLIADRVEAETGFDARDDAAVMAELIERARDAKHALSSLQRATVTLQIDRGLVRTTISRDDFERSAAPLFTRTEAVVERVLCDAGGSEAVDAALLVGGSTRMPQCRVALVRTTGLEPRTGVDPDAAVVNGAARTAFGLLDASRGTTNGLSARQRIKDVTAHALGFVVLSADGSAYVNNVMIARNAAIPASETKRHELAVPAGHHGVLDVYMLQGEASRPLDARGLGRWTFEGVPGDRFGRAEVDVSYRYDEDGVVHVSAMAGGVELGEPRVDRGDRDLRWTAQDPSSHAAPPLAVALVIDVSGSMAGGRLAEAKVACSEFVDVLLEAGIGKSIALVSFGSSASLVAPVGSDAYSLLSAIDGLSVQGSTNMSSGLLTAWEAIRAAEGRRVIVLLTDGSPDNRESTLTQRRIIVDHDGEIIARGVTGADQSFLSQLDSGSELLAPGEVASGFRGIAKQLTDDRSVNTHLKSSKES